MKSPAAITRSVASAIWNPTTDRPTAWRRFDAVGDLRAQGRERRREPEEQAGDDRDRRGKPEHLPVEMWRVLRESASSRVGERESREAADRREEEAFDEHLTEDASAPAPSASRTLISRCRRAPRASISVAMFAHASSRTSPRNIINTAMGVANACCCANRPRLPSRNTSVGTVSRRESARPRGKS
jgi:hypothetical protein